MPRLFPSLLLKAYCISPLLPLILRETRTLDSAINELRWLTEHISSTKPGPWNKLRTKELLSLCSRRSRAEPLQYILGSQPFGELDIKCRKGVLIPRPETEAYTSHLAKLILENKSRKEKSISILDVCSGSGCISLLLQSLLSPRFTDITILGLDISPTAIALAKENILHNIKQRKLSTKASSQVRFEIQNVLAQYPKDVGPCDIIISNPPYISTQKFLTETSRSARIYEPKLALVPQAAPSNTDLDLCYHPEDVFYERLVKFYLFFSSRMLVMEIGDEEQARRVAEMAIMNKSIDTNSIEVWRDWPQGEPDETEETFMRIEDHLGRVVEIPIKGTGMIRTIVLLQPKDFATSSREPRSSDNAPLGKT